METIEALVDETRAHEGARAFFALQGERLLEINLIPVGRVWTRSGATVARRGELRFVDEGVPEHGVGEMFKRALTGVEVRLTRAEGRGQLYLADAGKRLTVLELDDDALAVNGEAILAFEGSLDWCQTSVGPLHAPAWFLTLRGRGLVALATHDRPTTLPVREEVPLVVERSAAVAWSAGLNAEFDGDEAAFSGEGFVVIQPGGQE